MIKTEQFRLKTCNCAAGDDGVVSCMCDYLAELRALYVMVDVFAIAMKEKLQNKLCAHAAGWDNGQEESVGFMTGALMAKVCGPEVHEQLVDIAAIAAIIYNMKSEHDGVAALARINRAMRSQIELLSALIPPEDPKSPTVFTLAQETGGGLDLTVFPRVVAQALARQGWDVDAAALIAIYGACAGITVTIQAHGVEGAVEVYKRENGWTSAATPAEFVDARDSAKPGEVDEPPVGWPYGLQRWQTLCANCKKNRGRGMQACPSCTSMG